MRFVASFFIEPAKLDAFAAALHAHLLSFAAWLVEQLPFTHGLCDLDRRLRRAAAMTERIIFLHAVRRLRYRRPASQRYGEGRERTYRWRRTSEGCVRRLIRLRGLNRGSLRERAQRLAAILAAPEAWIAKRVRHLTRRRHGGFAPLPHAGPRLPTTHIPTHAACIDTS